MLWILFLTPLLVAQPSLCQKYKDPSKFVQIIPIDNQHVEFQVFDTYSKQWYKYINHYARIIWQGDFNNDGLEDYHIYFPYQGGSCGDEEGIYLGCSHNRYVSLMQDDIVCYNGGLSFDKKHYRNVDDIQWSDIIARSDIGGATILGIRFQYEKERGYRESYRSSEYKHLFKIADQNRTFAFGQLENSLYRILKDNPNDPRVQPFKAQALDKTFLKKVLVHFMDIERIIHFIGSNLELAEAFFQNAKYKYTAKRVFEGLDQDLQKTLQRFRSSLNQ